MVAMPDVDTLFTGSIAALYDTYLGPLIFEPYAEDLASRLSDLAAGSVLETAAGTGIVTRALLARVLAEVSIVATDLNQPMLDYAASQTAAAGVRWQQADAQSLPFAEGMFDAVVCQFGAMFFPDRPRAYREARRVLKPGGRFLFMSGTGSRKASSEHRRERIPTFPDDPPTFSRGRRMATMTPAGSPPISTVPAFAR
jgi:SAM-dependent methyltransferase